MGRPPKRRTTLLKRKRIQKTRKRTKKTKKKSRKRITKTRKSRSPTRKSKKLRTKSRNTSKIRTTSARLLPTKSKRSRWRKLWTLSARASQKHGHGSKTKDTGSVKLVIRVKSVLTFATTTFRNRPLCTVTTVSGWTPVLLTRNACKPSKRPKRAGQEGQERSKRKRQEGQK